MAILFVLIVWLLVIILHYLMVYKWTKSYKDKELNSLKKMRLKQLQEIENLKAKMSHTEENNAEETPEEEENNEDKNSNFID